jgi:hypothetical protein
MIDETIEEEEIIETPEQRLELINKKLDSLNGDLKSDQHYINDILFKNRKDFYSGWCNLLEEKCVLEGEPEKIKSVANVIRLKLIETGHGSAVNYMYEQVSSKFKSHNTNDNTEELGNSFPVNGNDNSSKINSVNFEEENSQYIETIDLLIDFLKSQKSKLKIMPFVSNLDPNTFAEENHILIKSIQFAEEVWDNRQSVPTLTQFLLAKTIAEETINHGSGIFIKHLKKYGAAKSKSSINILDDLTSKQSGKILKGNVRNILPIFEPKSKVEAIFSGFYGTPCENCDSFRVIEIQSRPGVWQCKCFNCANIFNSVSIMKCPSCYLPLEQETLEKIQKNNGKCISTNCTQKIMLTTVTSDKDWS